MKKPIGILAGGGDLPLAVADAVIAAGGRVHIIGIRGEADATIAAYSHDWVYWGGVGALLRGFRQAGCEELVIVGAVRRPDLKLIRPDLGFFKSLPAVLALRKGGDDSVLSKVVRFFEGQGFRIRGAHEFTPHLLAGTGRLGSVEPDAEQLAAVARAAAFIRALGPFDVGQAAVATKDRIIAIEGARGTDVMLAGLIARQHRLAGGAADAAAAGEVGGAVLVKLPKPGQELRVDMPTIGPRTIERARAAGLSGIAVAGGQTLMLEREHLVQSADEAGLFVQGIEDAGASNVPVSTAAMDIKGGLSALGTASPAQDDWLDIALGARLLDVLNGHGAGHAAVIAQQYVLAVQAAEGLTDLVLAAGKGRPWGRMLRRRRGVLVLHELPVATSEREGLVRAAAAASLAGIAVLPEGGTPRQSARPVDGMTVRRADNPSDAIELANGAGLFIVAHDLAGEERKA